MGFRVGTFASAEEFLSSDAPHKSDCLVLDIAMPGMSGLDLMQLLKASDAPIPVILITARDDNEVRESALAAGASGFLVKPFANEDLLIAVQAALGRG
jgi:FixJ family two-component response regulator